MEYWGLEVIMDFKFQPSQPPCAELHLLAYSPLELEVIDHLRQLTEALVSGTIGFEWYTGLSQRELARVGWHAIGMEGRR